MSYLEQEKIKWVQGFLGPSIEANSALIVSGTSSCLGWANTSMGNRALKIFHFHTEDILPTICVHGTTHELEKCGRWKWQWIRQGFACTFTVSLWHPQHPIMMLFMIMPTQDGQNANILLWMSSLQTGLKTAIWLDLYSGLSVWWNPSFLDPTGIL